MLENIIDIDSTSSDAFEALADIKNSTNDKESAVKYYDASLKYSYKDYQYKHSSEIRRISKKDKKIRKRLSALGFKSDY